MRARQAWKGKGVFAASRPSLKPRALRLKAQSLGTMNASASDLNRTAEAELLRVHDNCSCLVPRQENGTCLFGDMRPGAIPRRGSSRMP